MTEPADEQEIRERWAAATPGRVYADGSGVWVRDNDGVVIAQCFNVGWIGADDCPRESGVDATALRIAYAKEDIALLQQRLAEARRAFALLDRGHNRELTCAEHAIAAERAAHQATRGVIREAIKLLETLKEAE